MRRRDRSRPEDIDHFLCYYFRIMDRKKYVRASEIGSYVFCHRAWHLDQQNVPTTLEPERAAGIAFHQQHGQHVQSATQARRMAPWFAITAMALLLLALALR
jgi:hypothetical protein